MDLYKVSSGHGHEGSAEDRIAACEHTSAVLNQCLGSQVIQTHKSFFILKKVFNGRQQPVTVQARSQERLVTLPQLLYCDRYQPS